MRGYQPADYNFWPNRYSSHNSVYVHLHQCTNLQYLFIYFKMVCVICNFHSVRSIKWSAFQNKSTSLRLKAIHVACICLFLTLCTNCTWKSFYGVIIWMTEFVNTQVSECLSFRQTPGHSCSLSAFDGALSIS